MASLLSCPDWVSSNRDEVVVIEQRMDEIRSRMGLGIRVILGSSQVGHAAPARGSGLRLYVIGCARGGKSSIMGGRSSSSHQPAFDSRYQDLLLLDPTGGFQDLLEAREEPASGLDGVGEDLN